MQQFAHQTPPLKKPCDAAETFGHLPDTRWTEHSRYRYLRSTQADGVKGLEG
jgi:hypothetical protein